MVDFSKALQKNKPGRALTAKADTHNPPTKRLSNVSTSTAIALVKTDHRKAEIDWLIVSYGLGRAGHSHFSPSSSAGWLNCSGFLLANAGKPDVAGVDAAYGTVAHGVAAAWLTAIRDEGRKVAEHVPKRFLNWTTVENGFPIDVDSVMLHHIRRYIDWCREVEIEGDVYIEQRISYEPYMPIPNQGGTADHFVCISPVIDQDGNILEGGRCVITDLKMGVGIWVDVVENTQAMLYALGVFLEHDWIYHFEKFTIRICQPRLDYFGTWECSRADLLAFGERVRIKADQAWVPDAPRTPGPKQCQWCADKECAARSALLEDLADDYFDDDDVIEGRAEKSYTTEDLTTHSMAPLFGDLEKEPKFIKNMSVALMAWRYSHRAMFTKFFQETGEELLRLAQAGEHIPGWKIGEGKRAFKWLDPEDAAMELSVVGLPESVIFKTEVTSVAKAKTAIKAAKLMDNEELKLFLSGAPARKVGKKTLAAKPGLVKTIPGKPTLVPSGDPRIDVQDATDDAFDDDEEEDDGL